MPPPTATNWVSENVHVAIRSSEVMREEEIEKGYGYKVCQSITERFRVEADRRGVCNCGREPKRAQMKGP